MCCSQVIKADGRSVDYRLARPVIRMDSPVTSRVEQRGDTTVGVIKLSSFNARAQSDVAAAIGQLEAKNVSSYVLDLRDNRGGLVSEGLEVARLFLEDGAPLVVTESR